MTEKLNSTHYQGIIRQNNLVEKLVKSKIAWAVILMYFFSIPILRTMNRELPADLPVYHKVPAFSLIDENGDAFGSNDLSGKLYIVNFHFTNCPTICGKMMRGMQKIQKRVKGVKHKIHLVSITVDPENDTSKVLFKKARSLNANPYLWKFLTGDKKDIKNLSLNGFKLAIGDKKETANVYDIAHSGKFILVDGEHNIRGFYSNDKGSINQFMIDVGLLLNKKDLNFNKKESGDVRIKS